MFTSAVQTGFNTVSQTSMNSVFPASAALAKTALLFSALMLFSTPVRAQSDKTQSDENGELWMGHYFDYATYPHGHFDCAHGTTEYQSERAANNEAKRSIHFIEDGYCIRGMGDLKKLENGQIVTCNSKGEITREARDL